MTPPADKPMDRGEAVEIAWRTIREAASLHPSARLKYPPERLALARAVLAMDEELRSIEKERQP